LAGTGIVLCFQPGLLAAANHRQRGQSFSRNRESEERNQAD